MVTPPFPIYLGPISKNRSEPLFRSISEILSAAGINTLALDLTSFSWA